MLALSNARRLGGLLKPPIRLCSAPDPTSLSSVTQISSHFIHQCHLHTAAAFSGAVQGSYYLQMRPHSMSLASPKMFFSTETSSVESGPTEAVKDLYDKMVESAVTKRTMPPNAWLWSLIENCKIHEDIKLLFDVLQKLRVFRLSNLRIHADFNCHLCQEISRACTRVGAIDFGKKTLWKHNVYGVTPTIASANHLLMYAKMHKDATLMIDTMKLIKKNDLPLQPSTAELVSRICYDTDNWGLLSKYCKRFIKAGVKLRQRTFDLWMDFAAKRGDTESLWKIEKLRSESMKQQSLLCGFACAKGFLLERKPEDAASVIRNLNQTLLAAKKSGIVVELQKLVDEWPSEVVKQKNEDERKVLVTSLKSDIPTMVAGLLNDGLEVTVNLEKLTENGEILC
ncbi:hypothetical protein HS088_TW14G01103 [Tripterygium wilfordii]|uniref:Adenylyl cyclase n=1 Tax=Tripterygium wilfordii TaxID=458696 RepID=A0A7J7CSH0_TRIWF|nr:uncharacterized protein LOC120015153 [Tripterygium wilfordii]KAF5736948.1 hypothetical protein HS088_TW14G01103 [Tripterygium wilfordii]